MKTTKKVFALLLSIVFVFSAFATAVVAVSAKDYEWEYEVHDKEVHITGCNNQVMDVVIPEKIDGYPVTEISAYAFYDDKGLPVTSITVPKTVEVLGDADFQRPFEGIVGLFEGYIVDEDNKYYSSDINGVLYNKDKTALLSVAPKSPLKDYVYPDSVVETNCDAFDYCAFLETITISKNVEYLDGGDFGCFMTCDSLEKIIVDKQNNKFSSDKDGVLYNKEKTSLLRFPQGKETAYYTVPSYVEEVRDYAFYNCYNLICINLGQITSLGWSVFDGCNNLATVEAPDTLEKVGMNDFYECDSLSRFLYEGTFDQWEKIADRCYPDYLFCLGDEKTVEEPTKEKAPVTDKNNVSDKTEEKETKPETTVADPVDTNENPDDKTENKDRNEEAVDTVTENTEDNGNAWKIIVPVIAGVIVVAVIVVIVVKNKKK